MQLKEALQRQEPSLALQRAAADEIARLEAHIRVLIGIAEQTAKQMSALSAVALTHPGSQEPLTRVPVPTLWR